MSEPSDEKKFPEFTTGETIKLGFAGRCPRCGAGRIFSSYLKVADKCNVCDLDFGGHDAGDATAVPTLLLVGAVVVTGALLHLDWPIWLHLVVWLPLGVIGTLLILPRIKGIAIALQHKYRSTETDTERKLGGQ